MSMQLGPRLYVIVTKHSGSSGLPWATVYSLRVKQHSSIHFV